MVQINVRLKAGRAAVTATMVCLHHFQLPPCLAGGVTLRPDPIYAKPVLSGYRIRVIKIDQNDNFYLKTDQNQF